MEAETIAVLNEEAPCDECPNAVFCRDEQMACKDFLDYTNDGKLDRQDSDGTWIARNRVPTERHYRILFNRAA